MKTKNSKKVLALILSFFMILTVLPFNVMASGADQNVGGGNPPTVADLKKEATSYFEAKDKEVKLKVETIADKDVKEQQLTALHDATQAAQQKLIDIKEETTSMDDAKNTISEAKTTFNAAIEKIVKATNDQLEKEKAAAAAQLSVTTNVYYDAITGKVVDGNNNPVKDALVKVLGRTTYTDKDGNFTFNMTSESGNYYCGYYGYYWKDYPYNSYKVDTSRGSYSGNNGSYARYYFLVDGNGTIVDSIYANANSSYYLRGESNKTYTVYASDYGYGYGYGYGYPYYDKYYNRYYNPTTSWAKDQKLTASKTDYKDASVTLGYVTNSSWLYTTCYEYGYPYGYDRVIYPSALSLSGNGTIVSGKVGVSYLPIYVYRNGVFLGSGNADVNGYFSIGLNSRVSSTSDLTFYAYGKGQVAPEKKSEKADHGVIPVKSTVVIGSTKLIKNINGVEADVNMDVAPFIRDGRTMLPLRYIAEALGFKVDWDRATRTVTLTDKEFKVQIPVETNKIIVNGSTYYSDANPVLRNGRTMLPVANIARALGLKDGTDILWDANTRVATITRLVKY